MKPTIIKAHEMIDDNGNRHLLGDHLGRLYILVVKYVEGTSQVQELVLESLGETSCASTISYLDSGCVFIGSAYGDSQVIKLHSEKIAGDSFVEILSSHTNIGPIVDFLVVDLERQGQVWRAVAIESHVG